MKLGPCGKCSQVMLYLFNILFWASGLAMLIFGTWMLVDPRRSYLLDIVNYIDHEPLLKLCAYLFVGVGCVSIVVGFIGCCGALKEAPCLLVTFCIILSVMLMVELSAGVLAIVFKDQFFEKYMGDYLGNLTKHKYGRDPWATPLIDTVQYYVTRNLREDLEMLVKHRYGRPEQSAVTDTIDRLQFYFHCCGAISPSDWNGSVWQTNPELNGGHLYPVSCCVSDHVTNLPSMQSLNPSSLARCQRPSSGTMNISQWRHDQQQCCGGRSYADYERSWWQINKSGGRISYVPESCCHQRQVARPPDNISPVDPYCTSYKYTSGAFKTAVWQEGCYKKLLDWFDLHSYIFIGMALGVAIFQLFGIVLTVCLCLNVGKSIYV